MDKGDKKQRNKFQESDEVYTKRFYKLMRLIKISRMLQRAEITPAKKDK